MPEIYARVEPASGETIEIPANSSIEKYEYNKMDSAWITVSRSSLPGQNDNLPDQPLEEGQDDIFLYHAGRDEDLFGGRLREIDRHGDGKTDLIVDSFEYLAKHTEPTAGDERWENVSDSQLIHEGIRRVDALEPGEIETHEPRLTFIFSHVPPGEMMRDAAAGSPGYLRFNPDRTVDFQAVRNPLDDPPTLSPETADFIDEFEVEVKGGGANITHLRLVGAREGEAQVYVDEVADWYDPAVHEENWRVLSNKDITDEDTLQRLAERAIGELGERHIEVSTTIDGRKHHIDLGQTYPVRHDKHEIDHDMTVVEVDRVITDAGVNFDTTLSTRIDHRQENDESEFEDIQRYNHSFEGTSVMPTASSGRQPVGQDQQGRDVNCEFSFYYPDEIVYEHRAKLQVKGEPYRAYSWGAEDNADFERVSEQEESYTLYSGMVTGSTISSDIYTPSVPTSEVRVWGVITNAYTSDQFVFVRPYLRNMTTDTNFPGMGHEVRLDPGSQVAVPMSDPTDCEGNDLQFKAEVTNDAAMETPLPNLEMTQGPPDVQMSSIDYDAEATLGLQVVYQAIGKHTHDAEPGVVQVFADGEQYFPSECDVLVNGSTVGDTIPGGREFERTVDLMGHLEEGTWNTIEITSATLGAMQAHLDCDVAREILGDG